MTNRTLTIADIIRCYTDSRWASRGYSVGGSWNSRITDEVILEHAAKYGWNYENLFYFINSTRGRRYQDACLSNATKFETLQDCANWTLIPNNDADQTVGA